MTKLISVRSHCEAKCIAHSFVALFFHFDQLFSILYWWLPYPIDLNRTWIILNNEMPVFTWKITFVFIFNPSLMIIYSRILFTQNSRNWNVARMQWNGNLKSANIEKVHVWISAWVTSMRIKVASKVTSAMDDRVMISFAKRWVFSLKTHHLARFIETISALPFLFSPTRPTVVIFSVQYRKPNMNIYRMPCDEARKIVLESLIWNLEICCKWHEMPSNLMSSMVKKGTSSGLKLIIQDTFSRVTVHSYS